MKKRLFSILAMAVLLLSTACKGPEQKYTDWLYEYMPLPDSLHYGRDYWESNVAKTLEIRGRMA